MRAVNLIPAEARRGPSLSSAPTSLSPAYLVLAALAVALALVTVYVLSSNTVKDRQAKLAAVQDELTQEQTLAQRLSPYASYARLVAARETTIQQIAATRFDWYSALSDLSRVMPAGAALQSLSATVSPNVSVGGGSAAGGGIGTSSLRSAINAPAFELHGCDRSHDDVARLMSRLRVMDGVQRVTLADSAKQSLGPGGVSTSTSAITSAVRSVCGQHPAMFDLVVFFQPLAAAQPGTGGAAATPTSAATTTPSAPASSASAGAAAARPVSTAGGR